MLIYQMFIYTGKSSMKSPNLFRYLSILAFAKKLWTLTRFYWSVSSATELIIQLASSIKKSLFVMAVGKQSQEKKSTHVMIWMFRWGRSQKSQNNNLKLTTMRKKNFLWKDPSRLLILRNLWKRKNKMTGKFKKLRLQNKNQPPCQSLRKRKKNNNNPIISNRLCLKIFPKIKSKKLKSGLRDIIWWKLI